MGNANLDSFTIDGIGRATASGSAAYDDPTTFMGLVGFNQTQLGVRSALEKEPSLVSAKFETKVASGYWDKTITLWGRKTGSTLYNQLLVVTYTYNGQGQGKGYGSMGRRRQRDPRSGLQRRLRLLHHRALRLFRPSRRDHADAMTFESYGLT